MASVLSVFLGVGVLFGGCGADLSGENSQIAELQQQIDDLNRTVAELQQQIASLNQTILELQAELQNAKGDISSLQSQLAIASANYDKLYNQVYGEQDNYYHIGDTFSYSSSGIKIFDFSINQAIYNSNSTFHYIYYTFNSYIDGINSVQNEDLSFSLLFYDNSTNITYEIVDTTDNMIRFNSNIPNETREGIIYLFIGNTLCCVYQVNFAELSS